MRRSREWLSAMLSRVRSAWVDARAVRLEETSAQPSRGRAVGKDSGRAEDGYSSWHPKEKTGIPPIAVSAALRGGLGLAEAMLESEDGAAAASTTPAE